jgi:hypothetical protein
MAVNVENWGCAPFFGIVLFENLHVASP